MKTQEEIEKLKEKIQKNYRIFSLTHTLTALLHGADCLEEQLRTTESRYNKLIQKLISNHTDNIRDILNLLEELTYEKDSEIDELELDVAELEKENELIKELLATTNNH